MGLSFSELHLSVPVSFRAQTDQAAEQKWANPATGEASDKVLGENFRRPRVVEFFFFLFIQIAWKHFVFSVWRNDKRENVSNRQKTNTQTRWNVQS